MGVSMRKSFQKLAERPEFAVRDLAVKESTAMVSARARWIPVSARLRRLAQSTLQLAVGSIIVAVAGLSLHYIASNPGATLTWSSWWSHIREIRGQMRSDVLFGAPVSAIIPAVFTVILAPPGQKYPHASDRLDQEAAIEFVRVILFVSLLATATFAAIAAIPRPGHFMADTLVGIFLVGVSAGMSALLRPQGTLLALRRAESEARARAYDRALERQRNVCTAVGVCDWMKSSHPVAGLALRALIVVVGGGSVSVLTLVIFGFEEVESGGTSLGRVATAISLSALLGILAGTPALLVFQAAGEWRSGEGGRAKWADAIGYAIFAIIMATIVVVFSVGMWLGSGELRFKVLTGAFFLFGLGGFAWPIIQKRSRLTAAVDYRCLLLRAKMANDQWKALGGEEARLRRNGEGGRSFDWPFPGTT